MPAPLQVLTTRLGIPSSEKSLVKMEHTSSPPPLVEDTSGALEVGEIDEQQSAAGSSRGKPSQFVGVTSELTHMITGELQPPIAEYSALEDRFKELERRHSELQDLTSAYSEVIRGFSPTDGLAVSINQLQAEAGHDGLRMKALETDVLRPLIREAGGLQALISQTHTMRTLIDKAGGLRELEQFVSDLRIIRDTLDELKGPQGLIGLAFEVRDLLKNKQSHTELQSEVDGPKGLRVKAARYDKLMQAFADVQTFTWSQQRNATNNIHNAPSNSHGQSATNHQPPAGSATMNPARARMISATPLEDDPDRDLYEVPPSKAQRCNKTGSNNTPLGTPQVQPTVQLANQTANSSTLKRKGPEDTTSSAPAKRPRVDLGRVSALVQASLPTTAKTSMGRGSGQPKATGIQAGTATFKTRAQSTGGESEGTIVGDAVPSSQVQAAVVLPKMPDWMRSNVRFGDVGFTSASGARTSRYSSTPSSQDAEPHADIQPGPARLHANKLNLPPSFSTANPENDIGGLPVPQWGPGSTGIQLSALKAFFKHPVALWVGSTDGYTTWDACQSYNLKRAAQIPDGLLVFLLGELAKRINFGNASTYKQMAPSRSTCIAR